MRFSNVYDVIRQFVSKKTSTSSLKPACQRYTNIFKDSDFLIQKISEWVHRDDHLLDDEKALGYCKIGIIIRAFNLYKSINLLLKNDHWEDAAILSRSMFELTLNLGEIVRDEGEAEANARKYLRFQKLQEFLEYKINFDYEKGKGIKGKDQIKGMEEIKALAKEVFPEFINSDKRTVKYQEWNESWSGKSVWKLANDSQNKMHKHNYKTIYWLLSSFTHSSPLAMTASFNMVGVDKRIEDMIKNIENKDKAYLLLVFMMTTSWLLEILVLAGDVMKMFDHQICLTFLKKVGKKYKEGKY